MKDDLGDRMKMFEGMEAGRKFLPLLPICCRLDGRNFGNFTKGMKRPFDSTMSDMMVLTTVFLVEEANACIGYTQSDEISLILHSDSMKSQTYFDCRIQKLVSVLASTATAKFMSLVAERMPEKFKALPCFDCRAWVVPDKEEAVNTILWREWDCLKNSVSMLAQSKFSHKELDGKNGSEKQEMLFSKFGINWNDVESRFKRGVYVQRKKSFRRFSNEELAKLPPKHNARKDPNLIFERTDVIVVDMPPLGKVINRVEVIFEGAEPQVLLEILKG